MTNKHKTPIALSIAGSDSSGGAGIQADIKAFSALGAYGASVLTALTAQNTQGVQAIQSIPISFIKEQLNSVFSDLAVNAVKTGMLGDAKIVQAVADFLCKQPEIKLVVDPVMVAKSGDALLAPEAVKALVTELIPLAYIITPNLPEAAAMLNKPVPTTLAEMETMAQQLKQLGCQAVLLKGGHLSDSKQSPDIYYDGVELVQLHAERIETKNTHGTGCTLAASIAALLAQDISPLQAVQQAKQYISQAIIRADELSIGQGHGPVHHFHNFW